MARYYVIGVYGTPWVLTPEGGTLSQAREAIRWQGAMHQQDWVVATRTGPATFETKAGQALTVERGPFTVEAFEAFKSEWKEA